MKLDTIAPCTIRDLTCELMFIFMYLYVYMNSEVTCCYGPAREKSNSE